MTEPESALAHARSSAEAMRSSGAYDEDLRSFELRPEPVTTTKLFEWAVIDPDLREVRSTRRMGAPMTAFKRLLVRLLGQYHAELLAQQTRFNVNLVAHLGRLEKRVERLERLDPATRPEPEERQ